MVTRLGTSRASKKTITSNCNCKFHLGKFCILTYERELKFVASANHTVVSLEIIEEMRMAEVAKRMAEVAKIEFTRCDLTNLRSELRKFKMDSWQAADIVSCFLAGRGYGVNVKAMRSAAPHVAIMEDSPEVLQSMLEKIAYVM